MRIARKVVTWLAKNFELNNGRDPALSSHQDAFFILIAIFINTGCSQVLLLFCLHLLREVLLEEVHEGWVEICCTKT